jgi:glycosyltransferase involved in cell wall biosynthesis
MRWHIITGEYPPQTGGVSDYTGLVARGLADAGDTVEVWAPFCRHDERVETGIRVHRLANHFSPRALVALDQALKGDADARILLQYVPHAFGWKAMNLPFCCWLYSRRRWNIDVMFHEVAFQRRMAQPLRRNLLGEVTSIMAALAARSAGRIFVASMAWEGMLRKLVPDLGEIKWLPVPSNIPLVDDSEAVKAVRARYAGGGLLVGHLGTYGVNIRAYLEIVLPQVLDCGNVHVLLLGRGSEEFCQALSRRHPERTTVMHAAGDLSPEALSHHLSACDLMIQPYPDGVSARRTSAMAAISHGRATVSTAGAATENLWKTGASVSLVPYDQPDAISRAVLPLLEDAAARNHFGKSARELYHHHFDLRHTLTKLRWC